MNAKKWRTQIAQEKKELHNTREFIIWNFSWLSLSVFKSSVDCWALTQGLGIIDDSYIHDTLIHCQKCVAFLCFAWRQTKHNFWEKK